MCTAFDQLMLLFAGMAVGSVWTLLITAAVKPSDDFYQGYLDGWNPTKWWGIIMSLWRRK